jgi:UDP-N-acetylmuramoylalanine--D-glutamate ligase
MVLLGKDGPRIAEAADKVGFTSYVYGKNMDECVRKAVDMATEGDIVLLSPACASWDMYTDFEQRGNHFKEIVKRLIS